RLAGSDPARGHGIPVSKTGVSLLPEGDARRVTFRTRTRDRGTADGGGQLSDLRAEDAAARGARTLQDLFGVDISVGSVEKAWEETADAVEAPYTELEEALATEPVLNSDETGSRTNGDKRWVWALCSSWFVFYHIACSRGV